MFPSFFTLSTILADLSIKDHPSFSDLSIKDHLSDLFHQSHFRPLPPETTLHFQTSHQRPPFIFRPSIKDHLSFETSSTKDHSVFQTSCTKYDPLIQTSSTKYEPSIQTSATKYDPSIQTSSTKNQPVFQTSFFIFLLRSFIRGSTVPTKFRKSLIHIWLYVYTLVLICYKFVNTCFATWRVKLLF